MATYANPFAGLTNPRATISNLGRTDQGVDVTGSGPVYALGSGKVLSTYNSGWPGGGYITVQLDNPIGGHKYWYVAENITPAVQVGQRVNTGQTIGHAKGGYPYLESGWAAGPPDVGATLAAVTTGYTEGQVTPAGQNFKTVLDALMSGKQPAGGTSGSSAGGGGVTQGTLLADKTSGTGSGTGAAAAGATGGCMVAMVALPVVLPAALVLRALALPGSLRRASRGRGRRGRGWRRRRTSGTAHPPPPS